MSRICAIRKVRGQTWFLSLLFDKEHIFDAVAGGFQLSQGRTPYSVSKDLCVLVKGIIFDWSAHEGSYDMAKFAGELLTRCMVGLL